MSKKEFRYDIGFVVACDMPQAPRYKSSNQHSFNTDCPFCGKEGKMNIDLHKNVFACPVCGAGGGMLELHRRLNSFQDRRVAKADLEQRFDGLSEIERDDLKKAKQTIAAKVNNQSLASLQKRNALYNAYLDLLPLNPEHYKDLTEKRCLPPEEIQRLKYKSFSAGTVTVEGIGIVTLPEAAILAAQPMHFASDKDLLQFYRVLYNKLGADVPGWYGKNGQIDSVALKNCFLIPIRWRHGEISCLQQRYDNLPENASEKEKESYHKYARYASSWKNTGCSSSGVESIHYAGFDYSSDATPKTVWLTEGILKADIASYHSGNAFIALIGVNNTSQLPEELKYLKEHGTRRMVIAVDMDYRQKESVSSALDTIEKMVFESGLEGIVAQWDETYKGIDDYILAKKGRLKC